MTQDEIQALVDNVDPVLISRELIEDGVGSNYRTLTRVYVSGNAILKECFQYKHGVDSPSWAETSEITLTETTNIVDIPVFRTWNISAHPVTGDQRKVHLIELRVDKSVVLATVLLEHIDSIVPNKVIPLYGDNSMKFVVNGVEIGERDYWDLLTDQGYTPYQLLDARIPELDQNNRFNG